MLPAPDAHIPPQLCVQRVLRRTVRLGPRKRVVLQRKTMGTARPENRSQQNITPHPRR